jgi:hypothetical protein
MWDRPSSLVFGVRHDNRFTFLDNAGEILDAVIAMAVSVFPDEVYQAPLSWTEKAYPKLVHFNKVAKGGHFAAWEQPKIFVEEVRAGLRSLRK